MAKIKKIYVVLGSLNYKTGELNDLATNRIDKCLEIIKEQNNYKILCTGGFGNNFNNTPIPHAEHLYRYLEKNGVDRDVFLAPALSKNTVDDAVKSKEILEQLEFEEFIVITSDFHVDRVKLIFNLICGEIWNFKVISAKSNMTPERSKKLRDHENKAIKQIKNKGLYFD